MAVIIGILLGVLIGTILLVVVFTIRRYNNKFISVMAYSGSLCRF